jgi:hypothetical protein
MNPDDKLELAGIESTVRGNEGDNCRRYANPRTFFGRIIATMSGQIRLRLAYS